MIIWKPGGRIGESGGELSGELGIELRGEDRSEKSSRSIVVEADQSVKVEMSSLSHDSGRSNLSKRSQAALSFVYKEQMNLRSEQVSLTTREESHGEQVVRSQRDVL